MKQWKRKSLMMVILVATLLLAMTVQAQDADEPGTIRGGVYRDVNGDGRCVDTGTAGETPVPGVEIVFVSSDRATVVTLTTGEDGTYGLAAAGQSVWEVTARPDPSQWIVTSQNPLYVPVLPEPGLVQTNVNFCVGQGTNAVIVLPQAGGAANYGQVWLLVTAVFGLVLLGAGTAVEWRRRSG
jgi:hypothetical protein